MRNFTIFNFLIIVLGLSTTLNAQIAISKPNLGFTQACASSSFNAYEVTFSFSPEGDLEASNKFIIELSDANGSFSNAKIVFSTEAGNVTTSPVTLSFSIPNETAGEGYKVRVKSTAPEATSSASNGFAAYYKIQDSPFTINNLIDTGVFCAGGSYLLTIDNPGDAMNDSPLQYPSLTFNWYKETSPTTSVLIASGESLEVSAEGTYFVETNYGTCTSDSFSNRVTVSEANSGSNSSSISSSLGNPYCSANGPTILSAINGVSYQWFRNGEEIDGATSQMYETNEAGKYDVRVDLNSCTASASIDLINRDFTSEIDVDENNRLESGERLMVNVTTSATNPIFEWYINDVRIASANESNYEVTEQGNYKVKITQTEGCNATQEISFRVTEPFPNVANIPNVITPNGDGINDTWVIPQEFVSGTNTEVTLISAQGKVVLSTNNYQNNWPEKELSFKDVNPIYYYIIKTSNKNIKKGSITVLK
ncbi:T9SS type B sorting domain-containing protein [Hyunsoonleella pacifica]|uniref:Gliding motility-associated C-terminal domain-containing protein n=1 Tax=Hyunsoonleella pacifica TaxID=1080224 RepID=A0A4Q9FKQ3_9FLAO|nr:gliding motility-associated C-terminal domain-containing protein [Hyunsoonleella pacifica]TBN12994.1 gliding motility-associated C-terminal domain-containing protein [Hyunsoonleella pacifica]GGD28015.1 adhesin SprC [Hyunsoonleella pacifica]